MAAQAIFTGFLAVITKGQLTWGNVGVWRFDSPHPQPSMLCQQTYYGKCYTIFVML